MRMMPKGKKLAVCFVTCSLLATQTSVWNAVPVHAAAEPSRGESGKEKTSGKEQRSWKETKKQKQTEKQKKNIKLTKAKWQVQTAKQEKTGKQAQTAKQKQTQTAKQKQAQAEKQKQTQAEKQKKAEKPAQAEKQKKAEKQKQAEKQAQAEKQKQAAKASDQAQGISVAYHSQEEIRSYIKANGASIKDPLQFAQNPVTNAPYHPGSLSDQTQQSALNMLKQIRYIAGISDQVELSDEMCAKVQASSLVQYVNGKMSHYPEKPSDMEQALYQLGYDGAGQSNIAWSSAAGAGLNRTLVLSWMEDGDESNIDAVGHRRWLLNPKMGKTGFGAVSGSKGTFSGVYAFDTSNRTAAETGVAWPAQNMPAEYFSTEFPWSISMGQEVSQSSVKVKLTRLSDQKVWNFSDSASDGAFYVNNDGYGQKGCIIFRPESADLKSYEDGDSYQVTITGCSRPVSYTVNFFSLEKRSLSSISAQYKGGTAEAGGTLNPSDFTVTAVYSDGSTKKLTDFEILPYEIVPGSNDITIRYQDKTAIVKVTGKAARVTISFDAAGGTPVASQSVEKGSSLTRIPESSRSGYVFEGWYTSKTDGVKLDESTVLNKDVTYYAHWKAVELSSISVEFLGKYIIAETTYELGDDDFRVTAHYTDGTSRTVSGYTIDAYHITAGENTLTIRYGGKSATVEIYGMAVVKISAIYAGGMKLAGTTQLDDKDVRVFATLENGQVELFKYPECTVDPFVIQLGENILTVRFGGKSQTITVTGIMADTSELVSISAVYAGGSIEPGGRIDRTKLTVQASYSDGTVKTVSDYELAEYVIKEGDNTLTVSYQGKTAFFHVTGTAYGSQTVTVQFEAQGGSIVSQRVVEKDTAIGTLPKTERNGYTFDGWYTQAEGGTKITPNTVVSADVTYYAHWTADAGGDKDPDRPTDPDQPDKPTDPDKPTNPDKPDKPTDPDNPDKPTDPDNPDKPTDPDNPDKPTDPDNPDKPTDPDKPTNPDKPDKPTDSDKPANPDKPTNPDQPTNPDKPANPGGSNSDQPSASVTITFDAQGGMSTPSMRAAKNGRISYIPVTHRPKWVFRGWYTGINGTGTMLTLGTTFSQDVTYYAYWTAADRTLAGIGVSINGTAYAGGKVRHALIVKAVYSDGTSEQVYDYQVSQETWNAGSNGIVVTYGGLSQSIQVQAGADMPEAEVKRISASYNGGEVPVGTYAAFGGLIVRALYADGTEREVQGYVLSSNTIRAGSNTVTVHYAGRSATFRVTGYEQIAVTIHADGVSDLWTAKGEKLGAVLNGYVPARNGYQFGGWYLDEGCTQKIAADTSIFQDMQIYAKWQKLYQWKLNKAKAVLKQGKKVRLSVKGLKNSQIHWKTSAPKIASVSKNGVVKAKKEGTAVITAVTEDGSVMTCSVKVKKKAK